MAKNRNKINLMRRTKIKKFNKFDRINWFRFIMIPTKIGVCFYEERWLNH